MHRKEVREGVDSSSFTNFREADNKPSGFIKVGFFFTSWASISVSGSSLIDEENTMI
jgi:hypothetical protein